MLLDSIVITFHFKTYQDSSLSPISLSDSNKNLGKNLFIAFVRQLPYPEFRSKSKKNGY